jgi:hypothetical protein
VGLRTNLRMQVSNIGVCYTNLGKLQEATEVLSPSIKDWDDVSSLKLVYTTLKVLTASLNGFPGLQSLFTALETSRFVKESSTRRSKRTYRHISFSKPRWAIDTTARPTGAIKLVGISIIRASTVMQCTPPSLVLASLIIGLLLLIILFQCNATASSGRL